MSIGIWIISAWGLGIATAILARAVMDSLHDRELRRKAEEVRELHDSIKSEERGPFLRQRMLHEFNIKQGIGNAEIVELRKGKV